MPGCHYRWRCTGTFCSAGAVVLVMMTFLTGQAETLIALGALFFFIALLGPNVATLLQGRCTSRLTCSATGIENGIANGQGALGPILTGEVVALTGFYDAALLMLAVLLFASGAVILRFKIYESAACPLGTGSKDYHN